MSWLEEMDAIAAQLIGQFPGWNVWYVPHHIGPPAWGARPWPLLNAASPEHLAEAIRGAHEAVSEWPALASLEDYAQAAPGIRRARAV
jgi:hypothetical protein